MDRMYETVDKYRVPKFHLLIRIHVAELFHQIQQREWDTEFATECMSGVVSNLHASTGAYIQFLAVFLPELTATAGESLRDSIKKDSTWKCLLRPALNVVEKANQLPLSLVTKTVESVLSNEKVVNYSIKIRKWVKSEIQKVALAKDTAQDVRDILCGCMDQIDALPMPIEDAVVTLSEVKKVKKTNTATEEPVALKKTKKISTGKDSSTVRKVKKSIS